MLDQADLDAWAVQARSSNLTNEQAQAALTEHNAALVAQSDRFLAESTAHAEVGAANLPLAQQHARTVLDRFLPATLPEGIALRAGLDKTGFGNYAPLLVLFSRIGKAMAEDTPLGIAARTAAEAQPKDAAAVLYPGQT